jgi:putative transcriptional regulator
MKTLMTLIAGLAVIPLAMAQPAAQPLPRDDDAVLLVASKEISSPVYRQTVIVAIPIPTGGHVGVILNRPTKHPFAALFPSDEPASKVTEPVYFGGPSATNTVFALIPASTPVAEGDFRVNGAMTFAIRRDSIDKAIEETPHDARFFVGAVIWEPDELKQEIEAGAWFVRDVDPSVALRKNTERLWLELTRPTLGVSAHLDLQ